MLPIKSKLLVAIMATIMLISGVTATAAETVSQPCETCSMTVDPDAQTHIKVVDQTGTVHYVECMKCAFKVLKNNAAASEITIIATCDWNGPNNVITLNLKRYENATTVDPPTALLIDGGCLTNRIAYNRDAVDVLLANNGSSPYVTGLQKNGTVLANATILTIAQAALKYAYPATPDPTPTPSLPPTSTPIPLSTAKPTSTKAPIPTLTPIPPPTVTSIQECEACGMAVSPDSQAKYIVTDGTGTVHYVECFMCALNLVNDYDQLTITSYCDWYGPNYTIAVQSSNFGQLVNVSPSTAMFLNGGSCVINRVAYNQTAANQLMANGFSTYTLQEQHHDLPANTNIESLTNAALSLAKNNTNQSPTIPIAIVAFAGVVIIAMSFVIYRRMKL